MILNVAGKFFEAAGIGDSPVLRQMPSLKLFEAAGAVDPSQLMRVRFGCEVKCDVGRGPAEEALYDFETEGVRSVFGRAGEDYLFRMEEDGRQLLAMRKRRGVEPIEATMPEGVTALRFGLWMAFNLAAVECGVAAVHSSVVVHEGRAVLFLGESGTGKSTHTGLWLKNIEGSWLLNDDSPFIAVEDGQAVVYGSPWSGKTPCYRTERVPVAGIVRLSQAPRNRIVRLSPVAAFGALYPSLPPAFAYDEYLTDKVCALISAVLETVPVYHLECLPDRAAAELSHRTVLG